jgi:agmatine deiminase
MMTRRDAIRAAMGGAAFAAMGARARAAGEGAGSAGFRFVDEALPHERTFMQWPVSIDVYKSSADLVAVQEEILSIANTVAAFEPTVMLAAGEFHPDLKRRLDARIELWDFATDDLWCRDSGPAFVLDGQGRIAVSHFNFNGWGGRQAADNDSHIARNVAARLGMHVFDNGLVGEPGGVEIDGEGTLLAHESCWVNANRNAGDKAEVERLLLDAVGAKKAIWAPGLAGADITDYHIDSLARFAGPRRILVQLPDVVDKADPFSVAAYRTYAELERATDAQGRSIDLLIVPEPVSVRSGAKDFVASYVNYYVCNGAVIAPQFGDRETDAEAVAALKLLYPGREIVALAIDAIAESGGGIHCATHEQPVAKAIYKP